MTKSKHIIYINYELTVRLKIKGPFTWGKMTKILKSKLKDCIWNINNNEDYHSFMG